MQLLSAAPDAFAVTTLGGDLLTVNRAFLDMAQLADETQALGRSLGDWIGRPGADLPVLLAMLKKHGALRLVNTSARGEHGALTEVELSAVWAPEAEPPAIAFLVRDVSRRVGQGVQGAKDLTRAVEQLTGLVGRVSLPELPARHGGARGAALHRGRARAHARQPHRGGRGARPEPPVAVPQAAPAPPAAGRSGERAQARRPAASADAREILLARRVPPCVKTKHGQSVASG
jgi:hypothetical protein